MWNWPKLFGNPKTKIREESDRTGSEERERRTASTVSRRSIRRRFIRQSSISRPILLSFVTSVGIYYTRLTRSTRKWRLIKGMRNSCRLTAYRKHIDTGDHPPPRSGEMIVRRDRSPPIVVIDHVVVENHALYLSSERRASALGILLSRYRDLARYTRRIEARQRGCFREQKDETKELSSGECLRRLTLCTLVWVLLHISTRRL